MRQFDPIQLFCRLFSDFVDLLESLPMPGALLLLLLLGICVFQALGNSRLSAANW